MSDTSSGSVSSDPADPGTLGRGSSLGGRRASGEVFAAFQGVAHGVRARPAVLCDFDDTTAVENVAQLLLEHFSEDGAWRRLRQQSQQKIITLKEYQERAFNSTKATVEEFQAIVREKATLRPYFKDLWYFCLDRDIPLAIVTVGLDFYVDALLEREGLQSVPRYTVKTTFTPQGIAYEYPHPWDGSGASTQEVCSQWGNCKCRALGEYRRRGYGIIYVGDGRSDFCPASIADQVFAHGPLAQLMREKGMPYTELHDFKDVIQGLEDWADMGEGPLSGE